MARKQATDAPAPPAKSNSLKKSGGSAKDKVKNAAPQLVKYYLLAYNILSTIGWAAVLSLTVAHLLSVPQVRSATPPPRPASALSRLFAPLLKPTPFAPPESKVPTWARPLVSRAAGTYGAAGWVTAAVQSAALLEVAHVLLGWVRSPLATTLLQVASRLYIVWGIVEQFGAARESPFYASTLLSWSLTEVIRYSFYAATLIDRVPAALTWARYSGFYVLYPTGAGSEAALIWSTLPMWSAVWPSLTSWLKGLWGPGDYVRGALFVIWWPGLYVMYTYMIKQRQKVLGNAPGANLLNGLPGQKAIESKTQ